jgi:cysteinyl-tRNA synthetase
MGLRLFNTLGRETQEFVPIEPGNVRLYCCGPTVYNYAHIGNLRTYVFEDILRRTLEWLGYEVHHVMNITDVGHLTDDADEGEDKMFESSQKMGKSVWEIAEYFTDAFFSDADKLNIRRPTTAPRATEHIQDMIDMIRRLEERGYTYEAGGNVYFDTQAFENYGELALLDRQEQMAGSRVEVDTYKKHPRDFVLWFTRSKFGRQAMMWDSPWGVGYPGWHIECSAMSTRYLGEHFDIHCGGIDHIPVHHTNEIAQTEAATGKKWVNYWLHAEFLLLDTGKMSKSRGGFVTLSTLEEEEFDPLDYRYFCLGGHYRSQLQFSYDALKAARRARLNLLERLGLLRADAEEQGRDGRDLADTEAGTYVAQFRGHLEDDLNTPRALATLWALMKADSLPPADRVEAARRMDEVLGLELFAHKLSGTVDELDPETRQLALERAEARKNRDFQRADEIRDALLKRGLLLEDTPNGTRWKKTTPV